MKKCTLLLFVLLSFASCKNDPKETENKEVVTEETETVEQDTKPTKSSFRVSPIRHATMVITWDETTIYVDPVGGVNAFKNFEAPDLILITDVDPEHLSVETLQGLDTSKAKIIVPQVVADKMPSEFDTQIDVLNNGEMKERFGFAVEAIPMYNLRAESLKFHEKGRGNGYVLEKNGKRVYISGDTEDIPEMLALQNIDIAFVCMSLPYTMTEVQAANAVATFSPRIVYPYSYRGATGISNIEVFKARLKSIGEGRTQVVALNWYQ
ncbi:MBL fold metallo-hydrolase [Aureisphaera galaxeae]|uniref:MBL fold metallo-hydrolase n=1 Tax=Aureisphaera galaxeae TaxID=1538023 RepID=UPI002350ACCA|nr:MBL fold metallo-hydrolase [Aureisphaera galaxeae]MDC8004845.1 MBL fold metallo-hydrolase [Aureisphaera galaxeae]